MAQHHHRLAALAVGTAACLALGLSGVRAAAPVPSVVEVPFQPAFVKPPGGRELQARAGQILAPGTVLRTEKPGRLQVQLADGRQFRLGGDAVLRLGAGALELQKGQIIAWVNPGQKGRSPLTIRTRVATTAIVGTTVFLDAGETSLKVFSWEGQVQVDTASGQRYRLTSGQQLTFDAGQWQEPRRLSLAEAAARRQKSLLLNGFATPMETLPTIERELGISPASPGLPAASPATLSW